MILSGLKVFVRLEESGGWREKEFLLSAVPRNGELVTIEGRCYIVDFVEHKVEENKVIVLCSLCN